MARCVGIRVIPRSLPVVPVMASCRKGSKRGICVSGPDIFISYCRQERPAARLFAEAFAEEGFKVWWDAVLHSGETFDEVIERELRAAKAVVVLWSPQSVTSRWVRAEATQADRLNKLVPVIIEACTLPIIFELTHTADLAGWHGDRSDHRWESLVHDLRRHIGPKEEAPVLKVEPVVEPKPVAAAPEPPVAPRPVPVAVEPAKEAEKAPDRTERELAQAREELSKSHAAALLQPTDAEQAQSKFFKASDEFRQAESDTVHCLRRVHAPESAMPHVVTPIGLKIGRVKPADIIVSDPSVSREHCLVEFAADKLRVMDLNSTNGTYIDNKRIGRAELLPVGSVLRVGTVSFEHVVQDRADMEQLDPASFNLDELSRQARIARPS